MIALNRIGNRVDYRTNIAYRIAYRLRTTLWNARYLLTVWSFLDAFRLSRCLSLAMRSNAQLPLCPRVLKRPRAWHTAPRTTLTCYQFHLLLPTAELQTNNII